MELIKLKDPYYEAYDGLEDMYVKKSYDFIDFIDHMGIYQYRVKKEVLLEVDYDKK